MASFVPDRPVGRESSYLSSEYLTAKYPALFGNHEELARIDEPDSFGGELFAIAAQVASTALTVFFAYSLSGPILAYAALTYSLVVSAGAYSNRRTVGTEDSMRVTFTNLVLFSHGGVYFAPSYLAKAAFLAGAGLAGGILSEIDAEGQ